MGKFGLVTSGDKSKLLTNVLERIVLALHKHFKIWLNRVRGAEAQCHYCCSSLHKNGTETKRRMDDASQSVKN